ncbi:hypothetical protein [Candidatus Poriferisodalis sp.]|uniref:hypothetical protein n=1 Tax=Candidatus Poriferisodalis sp. TaxID=3101277 RepID=UPI003B014C21
MLTAADALAASVAAAQTSNDDSTSSCLTDLGTLNATTTSLSTTGTIQADAGCVSSLRDPADTTSVYYARRHTFTLDAAGTVSISLDDASPGSMRTYVVLSDSSGSVLGRATGDSRYRRSRLERLLLPAGTYTIEATSTYVGDTGGYSLSVSVAFIDGCLVSLGTLGDASVTHSGLRKHDVCVSISRNGPFEVNARYLSNYLMFTLTETKIISIDLVSSDDTYLYLLNGAYQLGNQPPQPTSRTYNDDGGYGSNSRLYGRLAPGTYTIEATTYGLPSSITADRATVDVYVRTSDSASGSTTYGNTCPRPDDLPGSS